MSIRFFEEKDYKWIKKWMYRNRKYYDQSCFKLEY